jgi:uncharacterized protein (DUF488 family)
VIHTIGHSTHSAEEFLHLLTTHEMQLLADIRTIPRSRRHPHFGREALEALLADRGIVYRHFPALGGLRRPRADSRNTGWVNDGFRGYADYMQTGAFEQAVEALLTFARRGSTAVMCAEAKWWQCHRRLLSVRHIVSTGPPKAHEMSEFARVASGKVIYPGLL